MTYVLFETRKFLKNPKNKLCLIILVFLISGLFILNKTVFKQKFFQATLDATTINLQQTEQMLIHLKSVSEDSPEDEELKQKFFNLEESKTNFQEQLKALQKNDLDKFAYLVNQSNISQLNQMTSNHSAEYLSISKDIQYYEDVKAVDGKMGITINDTSESAFTIGRSLTFWLSSMVVFVLLTVLLADNISNEIESSQIRFYPLIGGRKFKQLLIKLFIPSIIVTIITVLIFMFLYLIGGITNSFGSWQYPYYVTDGNIEPIYKLMIKSFTLFICSLLFISSLGQFLSLIFKKSLIVVGLITIFLTAFLTFDKEAWFQPIKKFLPFEYLGYGRLINDIKILPSNSFILGVLYLIILSVIFTIASGYLYQNYYYRKVGEK